MALFDVPPYQASPGKAGLEVLWNAVISLARDIESFFGVTIKGVTIGTAETLIAHGQKYTPSIVIPVPYANWKVNRTRDPDDKFCYFAAQAEVICDLRVFR